MSIHKKILEIQSTIEVPKSGYNDRQDFYYYAADDVLNAVRNQISKHGIIIRQSIKEWNAESFYDSQGRYRPTINILGSVTFIDTEDDTEHTVDVIASGSDTGGDKSPRKAQTQLIKIAFLNTFLISESNAFDSDGSPEMEPVNVKPAQEKIETAASVADLTAQIGELVKSGTIEASTVNKVGQRISDKVLGEGVAATSWRKDARVLQELANALKNGEVE